MHPSRHLRIGVCLSISFWGCVLWAIVETVAKTDRNWGIRFNVAMGCIGLDVLGFSWLIVICVIENCKSMTNSTSNTHNRQEPPDVVMPAHETVTRRIPPLFIVEILVDVEVDGVIDFDKETDQAQHHLPQGCVDARHPARWSQEGDVDNEVEKATVVDNEIQGDVDNKVEKAIVVDKEIPGDVDNKVDTDTVIENDIEGDIESDIDQSSNPDLSFLPSSDANHASGLDEALPGLWTEEYHRKCVKLSLI